MVILLSWNESCVTKWRYLAFKREKNWLNSSLYIFFFFLTLIVTESVKMFIKITTFAVLTKHSFRWTVFKNVINFPALKTISSSISITRVITSRDRFSIVSPRTQVIGTQVRCDRQKICASAGRSVWSPTGR